MSPAIHTKDKKTDAVTTTTRKLETNERERERWGRSKCLLFYNNNNE